MNLDEELLYDIIAGKSSFDDLQRLELIDSLRGGSMGEHSQLYEPMENLTDSELAQAAFSIWTDFCRDKGMF